MNHKYLLSFILVFLTLITISPMAFATPWDIADANYNQSFNVSAKEITPTGLFFKSDGTEMYVIGSGSDDIHQYSLSTAWDINSSTWTREFSVSAKETSPTGLFFKSDGTEMYVIGYDSDDVHQYTLSTAWNISTATWTREFSVSAKDEVPMGLTFKSDGTEMYMIGYLSDDVHQYTLSTAWNISTATWTREFSIAAKEGSNTGVFFKSDGTEMYVTGVVNDKINQYTLSTAWNISTATWKENLYVGNEETTPQDVYINSEGKQLYIIGYDSDEVHQYSWADLFLDLNINNIQYTKADFNTNIDNQIDANLSEKGFLYNTSSDFNYSTAEFKWTSSSTTDDNFSTTIEDLNHNTTYYAMAYAKDLDTNEYYYSTEQTFTTLEITETAATPTVNVAGGEKNNNISVQLSSSTSGASIYYTTDGSTPDETDNLYSSAIAISTDTTLKAIAIKEGYFDSNVLSVSYTFKVGGTATANINTGTYNNSFNVTLSKAGTTSDTKLTYTTNGSNPTIDSTEYTSAIPINATTTLKFAEFKAGYTPSAIQTKTYTMVVLDPTSSVDTGNYNNNFTTNLSSSTTGTSIYYTTDGSTPNNTKTLYTGAISISGTTTLKFIAYKSGYTTSNVITKTYTMEILGNPTTAQDSGEYTESLNVTLTKAGTTTGTKLTYTTNGTDPTIDSTEYTTPIFINTNTTLKFAEFKAGYTSSDIITRTYTIVLSDISVSVETGTYNNNFNVTLSHTDDYAIYYTTNGTDPDNTDTLYTTPISITQTTTLKAVAYNDGIYSSINTKIYTMQVGGTASANINTGTYNNSFNVTLSKAGTTSDTKLTYTTNGSNPTIDSTEYTSAITINATTTLKFAEFKTGYTNSTVQTKTYTMQINDLSLTGNDTGTYNNNFNISLSSTTTGTTIYYTTNGNEPTPADNLLTNPLTISASATYKFKAFKTGYTSSNTLTKTYTMEILGTPIANKDSGVYTDTFTVALTKINLTPGTKLTYTTNGTDPTIESTEYSSAITISETTTLKFAQFKAGYTPTDIQIKIYDFEIDGDATANYDTGTYYKPISVILSKSSTQTGVTINYTTNGTNPTIESTEYTTPILIDANTTLKFAQFKAGYNPSNIITKTYVMDFKSIRIQFYDENTLTKLDGNVSIIDLTNSETYYADENGYFNKYIYELEWDNKYINAYVERKVSGVTTHTTRNLQFYWDYTQDYDYNFMLLPINEGENIEFLVKDTNNEIWTNKYVQFLDSNLNIISSNKTDSQGKFTSYLKTDGDYNAVLYDATGTEGDTYQKTTVNVKKPKNEKSLVDISPYDVEVGGLLIYSLSNQSAAQTSINIFGGTTSTYDFTVVDYNADPVDRTYIPRTYNVKNPFGLSYSTTYTLQPYLITKEDGVIPSIVVYDELKTPYPGITVSIFKQIEGTTQLVEQKQTDSTGRTSFVGFPLDVYFVYLYENGTLKGSYEIQVRDTGETFYFVIQRDQIQDIIYKGLDLKYSWNNTLEYVDISTDNIDVNVSVYADYVGDFNITGYTIKTYQNGALKETETGSLSGTSVTFTESFNRLNYTAGMPIKVVVDVTFTYAGQTKNLNIYKTIAVDSKTSGLLNVLQNFPEKVGVLWTILLSILLTIGLLVLVGTSDFVSKDYLIYVGLLVIGFFVYIGWMATGIEVFGMDSMWFIYIVTVIAAVGFALQDSQR